MLGLAPCQFTISSRPCLKNATKLSLKCLLLIWFHIKMMKRFTWTDEHSKTMLLILNDEKNKGTSKFNWNSIAKVFNAQTRLDIKDKQASNHYSEMKEKFKSWEELQNLTGIAYDPRTKKVDVQEESLERYTAYLEVK